MPDLVPVDHNPFENSDASPLSMEQVQSIGGYLGGKLSALWEPVVRAHDAWTGERPVGDSDREIPWALQTAGTAMTGAMPLAQRGAMGIFGGRLSQTADQDALRTAQRMDMAYRSRDAIYGETGWYKGLDGQWRYEIPDTKAKFIPQIDNLPAPLSTVLDHPDFYAAYPHMQNMPVQFSPEMTKMQYEGAFSPGSSKEAASLFLNPKYNSSLFAKANSPRLTDINNAPTSVLLHEAQHAVQDYEGFAGGANSRAPAILNPIQEATRPLFDELNAARDTVGRAMAGKVSEVLGRPVGAHELGQRELDYIQQVHPELYNQHSDATAYLQQLKKLERDMAMEAYQRVGGEVESRNVEDRFKYMERGDRTDQWDRLKGYTPRERPPLLPPYKTQSRPENQQILPLRGQWQYPRDFNPLDLVPVEHNPFAGE